MASRIWWDGSRRDSAAGGHVPEGTEDSSAESAWFERQAHAGLRNVPEYLFFANASNIIFTSSFFHFRVMNFMLLPNKP